MKQAVLLLAHGAPERLEDIPEFLTLIRAGRAPSPGLAAEVTRRYAAIGGCSPLTALTFKQARALAGRLAQESVPVAGVYVGMRNWRPSIRETLERMRDDGIERIVALCLAPQYSRLSVGLYFEQTEQARAELGFDAELIWTRSFHRHPLLIEAFAEKLRPLLPAGRVIFTAHSLPEKALAADDPYESEARATAQAVAARAGLKDFDFAFQSQGLAGGRWLGPNVETVLDGYASGGVTDVVLQPVGFVADHIEILYDIDIAFRQYASERGMRLRRTESLNDSPTFIAALAAVVRERLEAA